MKLNPGDIIVSEGSSWSSRIIQMFTRSRWSHVGIVSENGMILEATKNENENLVDYCTLPDFKKDAKSVVVFHRPEELDKKDLSQLRDQCEKYRESKYAIEQAIFSNYIPTMRVMLFAYFGYPVYLICERMLTTEMTETGTQAALKLMGVILLFWLCLSLLLTFTMKSKLGQATTRKLYAKTRVGRYLLKRQHGTFCSKLVSSIDQGIGGHLVNKLKPAEYFRPIDIVLACKKMNWEKTHLKEPSGSSVLRQLLSFWFRS